MRYDIKNLTQPSPKRSRKIVSPNTYAHSVVRLDQIKFLAFIEHFQTFRAIYFFSAQQHILAVTHLPALDRIKSTFH
jgi:hypothetical protein